ncbi:hypothetical protein [Paenibacillus sp. KS-LC4]|uniref:hypothetical protein n=1 Tax=Paenibacillus sp. KS-LC4 TaxID=2979727 RepID=UPI0030D0B37E
MKSGMDRNARGCKGCDDSYTVTEAQIQRILAAPMFQSSERCVDDEVYAARLRECGSCPKLMSGTTCMVCGCIVRISAKYKEKSCPNPNDVRWRSVASH